MVVPFIEEKTNLSIISDQNIDNLQKLEILKRNSLSVPIKEEAFQNDRNDSTVSQMDNIVQNNHDKTLNKTISDERLNNSINNESFVESENDHSIFNNNIMDESLFDNEEEVNHDNSTFLRGPGQETRAQRASRLQNELKNKRKLEKSINTESPIKKKRVSFAPPAPTQIENMIDNIQTITKKTLASKKKKRLIKKPALSDWVETRLIKFINDSKKKKNSKKRNQAQN